MGVGKLQILKLDSVAAEDLRWDSIDMFLKGLTGCHNVVCLT
jgi:hypothetical protein